MRLLRLHIDNFGTLRDFDLSLEDGMNVLYQKNGWGKSTLAVFIKAMLYGLPATSKRSLDENERKKYMPWQGGSYGGSLEFETARGKFRVERSFSAKESGDSFALYDLATNKPSVIYSAALGEELFGIDADGFERSTYLSQRALTGGKDNNSISAKLGNLLDDVGDIGNYDTAMAALDRRRRYYVMTGNRGAIAELEGEILSKQTELERCRRVEEAMQAQQDTLSSLDAKLQAVRKTSEENRRRLEQAGLARERAALLERKHQMLAELARLNEKKKHVEAFFGGPPPTSAQLQEQRQLWEQIGNARARLDAIPSAPSDAESLARLRARFPSGTPTGEGMERAERDNEELRELKIRCETLQSTRESDGLSRRFATGAPAQPVLDKAFERLSNADKLQKAIDTVVPAPLSARSAMLPIAVLFLTLGIALAVLGAIPALASASLPLLGGGAVCVILGLVLCIVSAHSRAQKNRQRAALQEKRKKWQTQREADLSAVRELLLSYQMPTDDLGRSLTELTLFAERYHESAQQRRRVTEEIDALHRRREEIRARLHAYLARFYGTFPQKEDYRAELERLRRDTANLLQAEATERKRASDRAAAQTRLRELKLRLQPFLRRYDPAGELRAGECLDRVGEQMTEHRRLTDEIGRKEAELKAFVAEKRLDQPSPVGEVAEFDRLADEERDLQARAAELEQARATAKSSIDRLSLDVDRIPELEEQLAQCKLRLTEAKANADTVKHTASFLEEAKNALSTRYLDGMQTSFREFLSDLIGEDAPESVMDTSFEVSLRPDGGQTRNMESFSRGWRDAVEFCVRLSLTDALYADGEKPFLLLDDPFVNLDDERLTAARRLLDKLSQKYQILYLVCHRERI